MINRIILGKTYCRRFALNDHVAKELIDSPIIITGRGGSGTRLLSELMQGVNVFIGNDINATGDSTEWVGPVYDLVANRISLDNNNFEQRHVDRLRANAENILLRGNFKSGLWGFKLPETMLCLPELLVAFPNAKIIHLVRHPISISLRRSHMTSRLDNRVGRTVLHDAYKSFGLDVNTIEENEDYFNNAVSWALQLNRVIKFSLNNTSPSNYLQIRFEDLVDSAEIILLAICQLLNVPNQSAPALSIDPQRLNQVLEPSKEADEVWALCGQIAQSLGYSK